MSDEKAIAFFTFFSQDYQMSESFTFSVLHHVAHQTFPCHLRKINCNHLDNESGFSITQSVIIITSRIVKSVWYHLHQITDEIIQLSRTFRTGCYHDFRLLLSREIRGKLIVLLIPSYIFVVGLYGCFIPLL